MRVPTTRAVRGKALLADLDPELLDAVPAAERGLARGLCVSTLELSRGRWEPPVSGDGALPALLVADGVVVRSVTAAGFATADLLGRGDVILPRTGELRLPGGERADVTWQVVMPLTAAVLDSRFAAWTARWPAIAWRLCAREAEHGERLMARLSLVHRQRVDERLVLVLWGLAERWGKVTPDGVLVPIPLRHHQLAALVASLRPSVTLALQRLTARGIVERTLRGYLLHGTLDEAWAQLQDELDAAPLRG